MSDSGQVTHHLSLFWIFVAKSSALRSDRPNCGVLTAEAFEVSDEILKAKRINLSLAEQRLSRRSIAAAKSPSLPISACGCASSARPGKKTGLSSLRKAAVSFCRDAACP